MVSIHIFLGLLFFVAASRSVSAVDCSTPGATVREYTCFSFITCENGRAKENLCPKEKIFDPAQMACVKPSPSSTCGKAVDCSNKANGRYTNINVDKCRTYYTCYHGSFLGHNYCPASLVFNADLQMCDWSWATPPPCGTAVPTTASVP